jgi:thiamine transport system ATP-binding protein
MTAALQLDAVRFAHPGGCAMAFDFALQPGARLAVMGPSGAGKSTLLHLIAGFETPVSGSIRIDGRDIIDLAPASRPISMLFQDANLFSHLTVAQNAGLGFAPRLRLDAEERGKVDAALAAVGLDGFQRRMPWQLSGGERQRAALARILLRRKPLLLLDEPFAALGPAMRLDLIDRLKALPMDPQPTMIMVTHAPDDARAFATSVALVESGASGPVLPVAALDHPLAGTGLAAYLGRGSASA